MVEIRPRNSARLVTGELVGAGDECGELADHDLPQRGVAFGLFGVVADHEPLVLGDLDFLDLQVVPDMLVAALPRQRGGGFSGAGAEFLPDDVVPAAAA
jgi:hypothetical protein